MPTFTIIPPDAYLKAKIKIVGVGGGGCNALDSMADKGLQGVDFVAINTDSQHLKKSKAYVKLQVGSRSTRGLGAGGIPGVGEDAALEDKARIAEALDGSDMVFITAGLGGGTGTGASPVVSKVSREVGALTVGIVTMPFSFEGAWKTRQAGEGLVKLEREVDTLIVVPNDKLCDGEAPAPLSEAFDSANDVLFRAVSGITEIINTPGLINTDFADVRTIMSQDGSKAIMGTGSAGGSDRAVKAAESAVESPLLGELSIEGCRGVLLHIVAPPDFGTDELKKACDYITQKASNDLNFIFGWTKDDSIGDQVRVTIIATGAQEPSPDNSKPAPPEQANGSAEGDLFKEKEEKKTEKVPDLETPAYLRNSKNDKNGTNDKDDEDKSDKDKNDDKKGGIKGIFRRRD